VLLAPSPRARRCTRRDHGALGVYPQFGEHMLKVLVHRETADTQPRRHAGNPEPSAKAKATSCSRLVKPAAARRGRATAGAYSASTTVANSAAAGARASG
jgi:hypothetical protein